ncbi:MAG: Nudix family hydrolase [Burkholderiaceae bacterium]
MPDDVLRQMTDVARPITDVAVGVVFDAAGRVLVGQRVAGKPYGGWWEFPGGKFEPGEDAHGALVRELDEELGISAERSDPWLVREHVYEHAHVRLHFRHVVEWRGQARGREGQALVWRDPAAIDVAPLLPAAIAAVRWLALPRRYWITDAAGLGSARFLEALEARLEVLARDWSDPRRRAMLLLREPALDRAEVAALHAAMKVRIARAGLADRLLLLVSSRHADGRQEGEVTRDGLHLTGRDLYRRVAAASALDPAARSDRGYLAASCHEPADLLLADRAGADLAVFGPVLPTASHPSAAGLGWTGLARAIATTPLPVFALGGVGPEDLDRARRSGAHGIAIQRAAWR